MDSTPRAVDQALPAPAAAVSDIERKIGRDILNQAASAARRLLEKHPPAIGTLRSPLDLISLIEERAKTPRKYGVLLSARDKRCLSIVNTLQRQRFEAERAETAKAARDFSATIDDTAEIGS